MRKQGERKSSLKIKTIRPWEAKGFEREDPYRRTWKLLMGPKVNQVKYLSINMVIVTSISQLILISNP